MNGHMIPQQSLSKAAADQSSCKLIVRQNPSHGRVAIGKEKDRKPLDPPPFIQLIVSSQADPSAIYLQSPYYFMMACLESADGKEQPNNNLLGTLVSSLHKLKDTDNKDGGFFVFGDLSVKQEGRYRLHFYLHVMNGLESTLITSIKSEEFQVYPAKTFPGMAESTFLTRSFSDQGVRLRLRKDSRTMTTRKRNSAAASNVDMQRNIQRQRLDNQAYVDRSYGRNHSLDSMGERAGNGPMAPYSQHMNMNHSHHGSLHNSPSIQQSPHSMYPPSSPYPQMPPHQLSASHHMGALQMAPHSMANVDPSTTASTPVQIGAGPLQQSPVSVTPLLPHSASLPNPGMQTTVGMPSSASVSPQSMPGAMGQSVGGYQNHNGASYQEAYPPYSMPPNQGDGGRNHY